MKTILIRYSFVLFALCIYGTSVAQEVNGWPIFSRVEFRPKFVEDFNAHVYYPIFTDEIKKLEGKQVVLEGYVIPLEVETEFTVLSFYPYAQCFFCGGAGPESIASVYFKKTPRKFKLDEFVKIKGILVLNEDDIDQTNFIIADAEIIPSSKK
jgi:hypothetical protein